jgi:hypothetical protein
MVVGLSTLRERTTTTLQMMVESLQRTRTDVGQGAAIALEEMPEVGRSA